MWSSVLPLVPVILVASVMFNIATWDEYAAIQGDRRGFRVGQSDALADRIQSSGRELLNREWHVHLRIGELLTDGDVLVLPADNPLDSRLLTYLVGAEWTVAGTPDMTAPYEQLATRLDTAQIWQIKEGVGLALFEGNQGPENFELRRIENSPSDIQWAVGSKEFWEETLKVGDRNG